MMASPLRRRCTMSPGKGGARVTSPLREALKVFWKKLSPPRTDRRRPPSRPPECCGLYLDTAGKGDHGVGLCDDGFAGT